MDKTKLELSVGITSIIGILLLILGSLWGKDVGFAARQRQLVFEFRDSGGLRPGDPVTVNGVKKGQVLDVALEGTRVLVTAGIAPDAVLYADLQARVGMVDLMGAHKLALFPGTSGRPLAAGTRDAPIPGTGVAGIGEMLADAYSLKPRVDTLLVSLQLAVDELRLLLDRDNVRRPLYRSLEELVILTGELRELLQQTRPQMQQSFAHLARFSQTLDRFWNENDMALQTNVRRITRITAQLDTISSALQLIAEKFDRREGTLARLVYEDEIYERLLRSVSGVDSLTLDLRKNLGKYLGGAEIRLINLIDF